MEQAQMNYDCRTGENNYKANYKADDLFDKIYTSARNCVIDELLAAYTYINRKQGVTREQLAQ